MKTKTAEQILHKYFHHFKSERTRDLIVKAMEEYRQQSYASQPMSAEQVFPSWEDATKGITDSRFTELPEKNTIRQGARIMYDMLYRMMKSTAPTVKDGWEKFDVRKVIPFQLKGGRYIDNNGNEITTSMLMKHRHDIYIDNGLLYID